MGEPTSDRFDGAWLVTEYVFDPDGSFAGTVRQNRVVEPTDGRLRVAQWCEPDAALEGHPMAAFAGEWVFELEVDGSQRRYLGPDVVGLGTEWAPGAMTGEGIWPRFGYAFGSYSVLVGPDRQLTGGRFSVAGRPVADIVGVAMPEGGDGTPTLDLDTPPPTAGDEWTLQRAVGPMLIAEARPQPDQHRRLWAMRDAETDTEITIIEITDAGSPPTVTITVD